MSKDGELVRKRMQCPYHRKQVLKECDLMLAQNRIDQKTYDKMVEWIKSYD